MPLLWTWRDARPVARRALRLRVRRRLLRRRARVDPLLRRASRSCRSSSRWRRRSRSSASSVAAFARRGIASPFLTAAVWVVLEALRGRWPARRLPVGRPRRRAARRPAGAGPGELGGVAARELRDRRRQRASSSTSSLALRARSAARRGAGGGRASSRSLVVDACVADVTRFEPHDHRARCASRCSRATTRSCRSPSRPTSSSPTTHFALADQLHGHYDLIVFPESALDTDPRARPDAARRGSPSIAAAARRVRARERAHARPATARHCNTNLLYTPDGKLQGIYSKQHLVPFGEYVPWRDAARLPRRAAPGPVRLRARRPRTSCSTSAGHPIGSVICFESAFGPLVRDYVRDGAEVIVVSTNNRSYHRSGNSEQHLALGQMRAAETGASGAAGVGVGHQRGDRPRRHGARHAPSCSSRRSCDRPIADDDGRDALRALRRLGRAALARSAVGAAVSDRRGPPAGHDDQQLDRGDQADHHDQRRAARARAGAARRARRAARRATEPTAISTTTSHATSAKNTKTTAATPLAIEREHVLHAVQPLEVVGDEDAEQREQDHALRGAEVAAVDAGEEHADPQLDAAVLDHPAAPLGDQAAQPGLQRSRARTAIRISTGTTSSNTELGSVRSSTPPVMPPMSDAEPEDRRAVALAAAARAGSRPRRSALPNAMPDGVAHVGDHRRVPDGQQRGEGDERARAHDGVDRARRGSRRRSTSSASRTDMVPGTVDCADSGVRRARREATGREGASSCSCTRRSAWRSTCATCSRA